MLVTLKSQQTIQCTTKDLSEAGITLTSPVSIQERALVKVDINAFYKGFKTLDDGYDVICKFDADLIFPPNYLETIAHHFLQNNYSLVLI